jgi:hypothetical protein
VGTEILETVNMSDVCHREPCKVIFDDFSPKYNEKAKYNAVNVKRFKKMNKIETAYTIRTGNPASITQSGGGI